LVKAWRARSERGDAARYFRKLIRKWRLKHRPVADSLEEASDRLFAFTRLPPSQWRSVRTTNAIERLHQEFKRRIKAQILGAARVRSDHHAQGRWLTHPRHQANRSAN
jgi:transposase-like protein